MNDIAKRIANLSSEQKRLLEQRMRAASPRAAASAPIAIIGVGCRLPGGVAGPDDYWRLLRDGIDAIGEVPADRWDNARFYDPEPDAKGRISTRYGGFVADVDRFDASYFGISPREAERMDPQQRLLLEVAVEALEDSGEPLHRLAGTDTGVFVGAHGHASDYLWLQYRNPEEIDLFTGTGTAHNLFAGRLSYLFDLRGPAVVVDTACSSSLVAVHLAVQSLRAGESTLALAAGINLILQPHFSIAASRMHMLAADGRCKAFDQRADGFVRSEGCGVVVLKKLTDAIADGDRVRAVIRGSATNQDGNTNGITAPNGLAQRAVVQRALRDAGIDADAIGYVETHGTGTALGDPIEVEALAAVLGGEGAAAGPCHLGAVKTNIGHLEGAAGIAGLIKSVLVLEHGEVPRNLHFTGLNPHISLAGTRLTVPAEHTPWNPKGRPRLAGVSSFGWSGTNAHIVLEEAPSPSKVAVSATATVSGSAASKANDGPFVLPVSARSHGSLIALLERYQEILKQTGSESLGAICATAGLRRTAHGHRVAAVGRDAATLISRLAEAATRGPVRPRQGPPRIAFVFPGQGSQWAGMGRSLMASEPVFEAAIARCDIAIKAEAGWSVIELLNAKEPIADIATLQPTLFSMQVGLASLWRSWGLVPEAVVGHSMGEVAAAHIAGALSLDDAVRVMCRRSGLLRQIVGRGAMALVELPLQEAKEACAAEANRVSVAVHNGPRASVLSGDVDALDRIVASLTVKGIYCRPVKVDVASHSPQVDALRDDLLAQLAPIRPREAQIPIYSTVDAKQLDGTSLDAFYWFRNLREPVRMHDAVTQMIAEQFDAFIEISPHPILLPSIDDAIEESGADAVTIASTRRDSDERRDMLEGLARLFERGASPEWRALWPGPPSPVALPAYPWQRERFWIDEALYRQPALPGSTGPAPNEDVRRLLYATRWVSASKKRQSPLSIRGSFLLFADRQGAAEALAAELEKAGHRAWLVQAADAWRRYAPRSFGARSGEVADIERVLAEAERDGMPLTGVVHMWSLDAPSGSDDPAALEEFQVSCCASVVALVQSLSRRDSQRLPRITLVTVGTQSPDGRSATSVQAPLWGLGRVIAEEHPECWGGLIDIDPGNAPAASAAQIADEIVATEPEDGVALGGRDARYVLRLQPLVLSGNVAPFKCRDDASYLVTGGLGAVGLQIARWLAERGVRHLVLAGRSGLPPRESWAQQTGKAIQQAISLVQEIEALGACVYPLALDVTDERSVRLVIQGGTAALSSDVKWPPVRGIVHAAAIADDCLIDQLTPQRLRDVLRPKAMGAAVLSRAIDGHAIDFLVLCSSLGSLLGQPGQASYAAANAYLDALAGELRQRGVPALTVNWGAWAALGFAQTPGGRRTVEELDRRGIRAFDAATGTAALGLLLDAGLSNASVIPVDWARFGMTAQGLRLPSLVRQLASPDASPATAPRSGFRADLDAAEPGLRESVFIQHLQDQLAGVLRLSPEKIDVEAPMGTLGLESLTALEFRRRIEASIGMRVSAMVLWNHSTVTALTRHLLSKLYAEPEIERQEPSDGADRWQAASTMAAMSEEDALQALIGANEQ
jgi:acyl transferase domain-containing protein